MRVVLLALLLQAADLAAGIVVQDYLGREVVLPGEARRIVALAPHIVENLYAAGAGDRIVGAVQYSDYPQQAKQIPRVGSFNAFSMEAIIMSRPDLIIMWGSGNGMTTLEKLETLHIPVFVSEPRTLQDIPRSLRLLGMLAGTATHGETAARHFESEVALLRDTHRNDKQLAVLLQLWHQPLQTVNGDHLISEIIALCGAHNAFADAKTLAPKLNIESVLQRNPDVIIGSGAGVERPTWLDDWLDYPSLTAAQSRALFYINPDHILRPTPRVLLGARELCARLDSVRD